MRNYEIIINKSVKDSQEPEFCQECDQKMKKLYNTSIRTNDGFKK